MKTIMIIGGTDSSGGAGLTRDAFVARRFGYDVSPIVTAVTAQSNTRVAAVSVMPADLVAKQIRAALEAIQPAAVKIGMLGNSDVAEAVADGLGPLSCSVVIDPVLKASSGGQLMSGLLPAALLSQATLVTPNLPEAAALSGRAEASNDMDIKQQAAWFIDQGSEAVLIKGGHATGNLATDTIVTVTDSWALSSPRVHATLRGTGCALATAIACGLGDGLGLFDACRMAKGFVSATLKGSHGWATPCAR